MKAKPQSVTHNYAPAVYMGANKETVDAAANGVLQILSAPHADEETKRVALAQFGNVCSVHNAAISNCNFQTGTP